MKFSEIKIASFLMVCFVATSLYVKALRELYVLVPVFLLYGFIIIFSSDEDLTS